MITVFSKFRSAPEKYLNKIPITPTVEGQPSDQKSEYICPMHLDIKQNQFGYCPICGMDLEPQLAASIENNDPENLDMKKKVLAQSSVNNTCLFRGNVRNDFR